MASVSSTLLNNLNAPAAAGAALPQPLAGSLPLAGSGSSGGGLPMLARVTTQLTVAFTNLVKIVTTFEASLQRLITGSAGVEAQSTLPPGDGTPAPVSGSRGGGGSGSEVGILAAAVGGPLGALAGAASAVVGPLQGIAAAATRYAAALSPVAINLQNMAFRDLTATIGVGLLPIVGATTAVFREMAARLLPIMEKMQPIIASLSAAVAGAASEVLHGFSAIAHALMPTIEALSKFTVVIVEGVGKHLTAAALTVSAFVQAIGKALGGLSFDGMLDGVRRGFEMLARATINLTGVMAKSAGSLGAGFLDSMIKAFGDKGQKRDATGIAAVQNVGFSSFADFGRTLATQSASATESLDPNKPKTDDWLQVIKSDLEDIKKLDYSPFLNDLMVAINKIIEDRFPNTTYAANFASGAAAGFSSATSGFISGITDPLGQIMGR